MLLNVQCTHTKNGTLLWRIQDFSSGGWDVPNCRWRRNVFQGKLLLNWYVWLFVYYKLGRSMVQCIYVIHVRRKLFESGGIPQNLIGALSEHEGQTWQAMSTTMYHTFWTLYNLGWPVGMPTTLNDEPCFLSSGLCMYKYLPLAFNPVSQWWWQVHWSVF